MTSNEVAKRITQRREQLSLTQTDLAHELDVTPQAVQQWEKGVTSPRGKRLQKLAEILKVEVTYFFENRGISITDSTHRFDSNVEFINIKMIPVLTWEQAEGWTEAMVADAKDIKEWIPADVDIGSGAFGLIVRGESMAPYYLDGDRIQVRTNVQKESLRDGDLIIASYNGDTTFKKLVVDGKKQFLQALNKDWGGRYSVEVDGDLKIIGLVVGSYRPIHRKEH